MTSSINGELIALQFYIIWEIDEATGCEVVRNVVLTSSAIFAVTLVFLGDVKVALVIMGVILLSLVRLETTNKGGGGLAAATASDQKNITCVRRSTPQDVFTSGTPN